MSKVKITLAVGISLMAAVGVLVLAGSPPRVVRVAVPGGLVGNAVLQATSGEIAVCQPNEVLPGGVSSIRLSMWAFYGSQVHVVAYSGSRAITEGKRGANWTSDSVTVPVKPLDHATSNVRLCFALGPNSEPIDLLGPPTPAQDGAVVLKSAKLTANAAVGEERPLGGRIGLEYLSAGRRSWWSRILSVARRTGLGRAYSGTWIALLIAVLMAAVGVLAVRLTLRELP
jgi:hypothetical protein